MATLTGKLTDVASRSPDSISTMTVKAPAARIGGSSGSSVIVSSPARVDFNRSTGDITISGLTGGLSWLYIEGDGWTDSIPLAVAEGMITLVEAIANASGLPGVLDYLQLLGDFGDRIDSAAQEAADTAVDGAMGDKVRAAESAAKSSALSSSKSAIESASAHTRADSAEDIAENAVDRVAALEALGGLSPESPVDGQTANLVDQQSTLTRDAVNRAVRSEMSVRVGSTRIDVVNAAETLDSAGIQAVIDAAPAGAEFFVSSERGNQIALDTAPLTPSANGQSFIHDRSLTVFQPNLYMPVYDILDRDNITIHDLTATGPDVRPVNGNPFRGSSHHSNYGAAIWTNSSSTRVTGKTFVTNFKVGVNFSAWDSTANSLSPDGHEDSYVEDLSGVGTDFGILYTGQKNLRIDKVTTWDHKDSSELTDPNHAVYGAGNESVRSENVSIGVMTCRGLQFGQPFSFKNTVGLVVESGTAVDCVGLLNLQDVRDFRIGSMSLIGSKKPLSGVSSWHIVSAQSPLVENGSIQRIDINDSVDALGGQYAVYWSGNDVNLGDISIVTNRETEGTDVVIGGESNVIRSVSTVAVGVHSRSLQIGAPSSPAVGTEIHAHSSRRASRILTHLSTSQSTVYSYTPSTHRELMPQARGLEFVATSGGSYSLLSSEPPTPITISTPLYQIKPLDQLVLANMSAAGDVIYLSGLGSVSEKQSHQIKNIGAHPLPVRVRYGEGESPIDDQMTIMVEPWETRSFMVADGRWITV